MSARTRLGIRLRRLTLGVLIVGLRTLYAPIKLLPQRHRVVILSRQDDAPSEDVALLSQELLRRAQFQRVAVLTKRLSTGLQNRLSYVGHMVHQMAVVAQSEVVVLDGYSIVASVLRHKPNTRIVQIWHGSGSFKRFGFDALGLKRGRPASLAKLFRMHAQYDTVVCSAEVARAPFASALGADYSQTVVCPLPHFDLLNSEAWLTQTAKRIYARFPDLANQQIILWAPTSVLMGVEKGPDVSALVLAANASGVAVITSLSHKGSSVLENAWSDFSTLEWLTVADAFVTDQSSLIFEAAKAGRPVHIYSRADQVQRLIESSYIEPSVVRPLIKTSAEAIVAEVLRAKVPTEHERRLAEMYVQLPADGSCVSALADIVGLGDSVN